MKLLVKPQDLVTARTCAIHYHSCQVALMTTQGTLQKVIVEDLRTKKCQSELQYKSHA